MAIAVLAAAILLVSCSRVPSRGSTARTSITPQARALDASTGIAGSSAIDLSPSPTLVSGATRLTNRSTRPATITHFRMIGARAIQLGHVYVFKPVPGSGIQPGITYGSALAVGTHDGVESTQPVDGAR